jgi:hypothetical protein
VKQSHVPAIADRQAGVFTASQAAEAGFTDRQVRRRLHGAAWVRVAGRGLCGQQTGRNARVVAWAVHLTFPRAVVSHGTAAWLHGFPVTCPLEAHAIVAAGSGRSRSIRTWRGAVAQDERYLLDGEVPVTSPPRTATECLATLPREQSLSLLAWVVTRKFLDVTDLPAALPRYRGKSGFEQIAFLCDLTRRGALSVAEARCHAVLDAHGITGWTANVTINDHAGIVAVVDLLFERARVIVEIDGWATHGSRAAFVRDRQRQTRLAAAGYVVLRVTWDDLTKDDGRLFATLLKRTLADR